MRWVESSRRLRASAAVAPGADCSCEVRKRCPNELCEKADSAESDDPVKQQLYAGSRNRDVVVESSDRSSRWLISRQCSRARAACRAPDESYLDRVRSGRRSRFPCRCLAKHSAASSNPDLSRGLTRVEPPRTRASADSRARRTSRGHSAAAHAAVGPSRARHGWPRQTPLVRTPAGYGRVDWYDWYDCMTVDWYDVYNAFLRRGLPAAAQPQQPPTTHHPPPPAASRRSLPAGRDPPSSRSSLVAVVGDQPSRRSTLKRDSS